MTGSGGVSVRAGPSARPSGRRQAQRQAQRRALRRSSRDKGESEARHIDAALVCSQCGQLSWPQPSHTTPHRHEGTSSRHGMPPCSHCGDDGWIDLGHPSTALALRMSEDQDAQQRVSLPKRMVGYGIFGVAIGWFLGLMASSGIGVTLAITGLCGVIGALVVLHQHRASGSPEPSVLPARWAMALPPAPGTHPEVSGPVTTTADALRAPLSGRRCIAWEVGVRHDTQADADDASWWLLEQKLVPVSVGDEALDPARTHLRVPRVHFGPLATAKLDEAARLFLRQRGIGGSEVANVELFETVIEADAPVRVQIGPHRSSLEPVRALVPSGA